MSETVHVVAVLHTRPGTRDAVLAAFGEVLPAVCAEKGCVSYVPSVDAPGTSAPYGEDIIVVVEEWACQGDLDAHAVAPHMAKFSKKIEGNLVSLKVHTLTAA